MGTSAVTEVLITVLLAIFTAGAGAAANIAAKSGKLIKVFNLLKKITTTIKKISPNPKLLDRGKNAAAKAKRTAKTKAKSTKRMPDVDSPKKTEKLDKTTKKGYGDDKDNGPKTTPSDPKKNIASAGDSNKSSKLRSVSSLNKRQKAIHEKLANKGDVAQLRKKDVSMADLQSLSEVTGDEYNMFTLGGRRTIIRGHGNQVSVSPEMYDELLAGKHGKWSGHTHPPGYSLDPGPADRPFLEKLGQDRSTIWGDDGHHTFGKLPSDDEMIAAEKRRKQWMRIYGN